MPTTAAELDEIFGTPAQPKADPNPKILDDIFGTPAQPKAKAERPAKQRLAEMLASQRFPPPPLAPGGFEPGWVTEGPGGEIQYHDIYQPPYQVKDTTLAGAQGAVAETLGRMGAPPLLAAAVPMAPEFAPMAAGLMAPAALAPLLMTPPSITEQMRSGQRPETGEELKRLAGAAAEETVLGGAFAAPFAMAGRAAAAARALSTIRAAKRSAQPPVSPPSISPSVRADILASANGDAGIANQIWDRLRSKTILPSEMEIEIAKAKQEASKASAVKIQEEAPKLEAQQREAALSATREPSKKRAFKQAREEATARKTQAHEAWQEARAALIKEEAIASEYAGPQKELPPTTLLTEAPPPEMIPDARVRKIDAAQRKAMKEEAFRRAKAKVAGQEDVLSREIQQAKSPEDLVERIVTTKERLSREIHAEEEATRLMAEAQSQEVPPPTAQAEQRVNLEERATIEALPKEAQAAEIATLRAELAAKSKDAVTGLYDARTEGGRAAFEAKAGPIKMQYDVVGLGAFNKYGEEGGNALLNAARQRLIEAGVPEERLARWGGDELAGSVDTPEQAAAVKKALSNFEKDLSIEWEWKRQTYRASGNPLRFAVAEGSTFAESGAMIESAKTEATRAGLRAPETAPKGTLPPGVTIERVGMERQPGRVRPEARPAPEPPHPVPGPSALGGAAQAPAVAPKQQAALKPAPQPERPQAPAAQEAGPSPAQLAKEGEAVTREVEPPRKGEAGGVQLASPTEFGKGLGESASKTKESFKGAAARGSEWAKIHLYDSRGLEPNYLANKDEMLGRRYLQDGIIGRITEGLMPRSGVVNRLLRRGLTEEDNILAGKLRRREVTTDFLDYETELIIDKLGGRTKATEELVAFRNDRAAKLKGKGLSKENRKAIEADIRGLDEEIKFFTVGDSPRRLPETPENVELSRAVTEAMKYDFENGTMAVDVGLMDRVTLLRHAARYEARLYVPKLDEMSGAEISDFARAVGISRKHFKQRLREGELGSDLKARLIANRPAWTFGRSASKTRHAIESKVFFDNIAGDPDIVSSTAIEGWKKVPKDARWGPLQEKYVSKATWYDLNETWGGHQPSFESAMRILIDPVQELWSHGKVVLSPATWMRNMASNVLQLTVAGLPPHKFHLIGSAAKELYGKGPTYQAAIKAGLPVQGGASGELRVMIREAEGIREMSSGLRALSNFYLKAPGIKQLTSFYNAQDAVSKLALWKYLVDSGVAPRQATAHVNLSLPNYQRVSRMWEWLGRRAWPLSTFTYKTAEMAPRILTGGFIGGTGKRLFGQPGSPMSAGLPGSVTGRAWTSDLAATARFYAMAGGLWYLNDVLQRRDGMTPEIWKKIEDMAPEYTRQGLALYLPIQEKGEVRYLDLTYSNPYPSMVTGYNAVKLARQQGFGSLRKALSLLEPTHPLYQYVAHVQNGYDPHTKRRLWAEGLEKEAERGDKDAEAEVSEALGKWIKETIMPSLYGQTKRIGAAAAGEEHRGAKQTVTEAVGQGLLGVNIRKLNLEKLTTKRKVDLASKAKKVIIGAAHLQQDILSGKLKATDANMTSLERKKRLAQALAKQARETEKPAVNF